MFQKFYSEQKYYEKKYPQINILVNFYPWRIVAYKYYFGETFYPETLYLENLYPRIFVHTKS